MKKVWLILAIFIIGMTITIWYKNKLDYNKIILVLPSSNRVSSPYFYKKDGDFFLAQDLKLGFEKLGYNVEYRFREDYDNINFGNAGNIIYFKGYYNFTSLFKDNNPKRKTILYVYYIEGLNQEILKQADVIASASKKFIKEFVMDRGYIGKYIPQYTNPDRFFPYYDNNINIDVLFVGSNHTRQGRESLNFAINSKIDVDVYGKFWEGYIPFETLKGNYIENDELHKYYSLAKIVLNDHRKDMKYFGFISNRIYDVTASGGFIFTDYLKEIEEVYGDSIAMYKNEKEFREKLEYYLNNENERKEMSKRAQKITLENFTNVKIAQKFIEILKNIKK